jgi:predicted AlkP superfamily pyrophosphatase or phosphodiesterase
MRLSIYMPASLSVGESQNRDHSALRSARIVAFALLSIAALFAPIPAMEQSVSSTAARHKLLVLSIDGLDWRYIKQGDAFHLRIPNIRRLMREGSWADGVVGVYPSVTWPSHTTLITGVIPNVHGILGNRRPRAAGGDYYWSSDLLKAPTLWQAAKNQGLTTASVTWPVTTGADITYDLPEYFMRRNGGSMDLASVASRSTTGLVEAISAEYPSFPQQWVDDRTRALAVLYLLKARQPDLLLAHMVDLDSEEHDQGPFATNSFAIMERTDELIGQIVAALPKGYDFALVSDHGFERMDNDANLKVLLQQHGITGDLEVLSGLVATTDPKVADFLREAAHDPANKIGREIPHEEVVRYAPQLAATVAAFEPTENTAFGRKADGPFLTPPPEKGDHGLWPTHAGYRSVFVTWGPGIRHSEGPEMQMTEIAAKLAALAGVRFPVQ